jgi:hypothetical protein
MVFSILALLHVEQQGALAVVERQAVDLLRAVVRARATCLRP